MKPPFSAASALLLGVISGSLARAEPPASVQTQVSFLLGYVEGSRCEFYRNGTWYDSNAAQTHLREKYNYLTTGNAIHTAEDFIAKAATVSSFSGQPYEVRCNGGASVTSSQWLREELARLRAFQ